MKILLQYYLREFLKLFLILTAGMSITFSLIELINRIEDFAGHKPSVGELLRYALLNVPQYVLYLMPMAGLVTGLFVFGQAMRRKEIIAIKASGGSIKALLSYFVFVGILLTLLSFVIGEFVTPGLSRKAHTLRDTLMEQNRAVAVKEGTLWLRSQNAVVKAEIFLPDKGILRGISILKIEDDMLTERIEADSAQWRPSIGASGAPQGGAWYLTGATVYDLKSGTMTKHAELPSPFIDSPDIFKGVQQKPDEMNVRELGAYTERLRNAGFRNTKLLVDIHSRISYPLINAIMLVLGISLSAMGTVGGGLITAAIGIAISLLYWVVFTAFLSLGYAGVLPPLLAAWTIPLLFGMAAFYLFRKIPE